MQKIVCPACNHAFHAEEVISRQLTRDLEKKFREKEESLLTDFQKKMNLLEGREQELEAKIRKENTLFAERIEKEKIKIQEQIRIQQERDFRIKLDTLEKERNEQAARLEALTQAAVENEQLKRKLGTLKSDLELQMQIKMTEELGKDREQIRREESRKAELRQRELEKQLDDQKKLIEDLQRKTRQGSSQAVGEAQELAIEDYLREQFPLDEIEEVRKGVRGADCIQRVHTRLIPNAGTIYYESKRTKDFQAGWIEKLKEDMRLVGADLGILVTQAMPKDMPHMGERQGIWICSYEDFKPLAGILRHGLIEVATALRSQENKSDKLHLLYTYLTGNDFKMQIEAIVEGFKQIQDDLQKEKIAMHRLWAQREKIIDKVLLNTSQFYGSVRGIAGSAIPVISVLDLPGEPESL
ncbi:MAG TPA: DUF2130 domain-containing protein [Saprospiraceae bacterium]|nr:DUF2130 domain-containing protein [Saprospiraceae bacterium]HNT21104.1 DUF2130 domain-containing protein [Saprospiraceae bacterium]